ncbi:MAG: SUMF1/EgtB/PvdO family nonheme iron enzyme [Spirochaetia bacterium]
MNRRFLTLVFFTLISVGLQAENRQALLIANSAYTHFGSLQTPVPEAQDLAATLERLGFKVTLLKNSTREEMLVALDKFGSALKGKGGIAFFHYGGHGVQVGGKNYLIPADADIPDELRVRTRAIDVDEVMATLSDSGADTSIVILDACRNDPLPASSGRSATRGLTVVGNQPKNSIIVYAAKADSVAHDGLFTPALTRALAKPGLSLLDVLTEVRNEVYQKSNGEQTPGDYNQLFTPVYLAGSGSAPAPAVTPAKKPSLTVEKAYGSVTIKVRTGGTLYLNGTAMGQLTPGSSSRLDDIEAGQASLEMRYADGKSETLTADVTKDAVTAVAFSYSASVERPKVPENMIRVEGGTFQMGDTFGDGQSWEKPVHSVAVSSFYMGKYLVTQKEWRDVMGTDPSHFKGDDLPVESVTWYDAVQYCNKLSAKNGLDPCYAINGTNVTCDFSRSGFRLPTEAEWEYAAKGGRQSRGTEYAGSSSVDEVAWYGGNSGGRTHPVGQKRANELGLYDMSGNVWEWCWDWWGNYGPSTETDPQGADSGSNRVRRGGSGDGSASGVRAAGRDGYGPGLRYNISGFRVVRRSG